MSWSDPIADMLTRMRNALASGRELVEMPHSKLKGEIARVLKREGYIEDFAVEGDTVRNLKVFLKYTGDHKPAIRGLRRTSSPGRRVYASAEKVPVVLNGLGISLISTSSGILSDKEVRQKHVGGEVLCNIW